MDKPPSQTELRILLLEDVPTDAELVENALRDADLSFTAKRVDTRDAFARALEEFKPDIVLADYNLPAFDGGSAVKIVRQQYPTIPVVMVTGAIGDEKAIELLKLGARDYVLKDQLARLGPAVRRTLSEEQGIRARKAAENALRQSEEQFRSVFENAKDVILTLSMDGNLTMLNPAFEQITGWARDEWLGKSFSPLVHPDDLPDAMQLLRRALHGEALPVFELRVRKKNGGYVVGEITIARLVYDSANAFLLGIARDITVRKQLEEELRQSEAKFRTVVETTSDWIWEINEQGVYTYANPRVYDLLGYRPDEVIGKTPFDMMREEEAARVSAVFTANVARQRPFQLLENTCLHKDGHEVVLETSGIPVFNGNGAFRGYRGVDRDITARKLAEEALRESEARYRRITEGLTDYQYTVRVENGRAVETTQSPACVTVTGYTADEFISNPYLWIQMVAPEDRELVRQHAAQILAGKDVPPLEHRIIRKDGGMRWVSDTTILFKDASGKLLSYDGVIKDITERRHMEDAIKEASDRNRAITETANDAIICMRPDGIIHLWNHKAEELFGFTAAEAVGKNLHGLIVPERYRERVLEGLRRYVNTGEGYVVGKTLELAALHRDGTEFPVELSVSSMNIRGEWHATGIIRDITERKQTEAALARNARDLGERVKEIRCLYEITTLLLNKEWSMGQILNACTQLITAALLDPQHTCARIRLGEQMFETTNFRETEWKLQAPISVPGMAPGLVEVFYFGEITGDQKSPFLEEERHLIQAISTQIAQSLERRQAEARIRKLTRLYATLSQTNKTIVHSENRDDLFRDVCKGAVEHGKFIMAWVGLADEATRMVKPAFHHGAEQGYLTDIVISAEDVPAGRGPTGTAIRENRVSFVNDYATDERTWPWREAALKRGFRGGASVPLRFRGKAIGALTLYADETNFFDADQLELLEEMATDISFAMDGFEREALRRHAEEGREAALLKLRKALEDTVGVAASISEVRDPYTAGHQLRVSQLAAAIAVEMGIPQSQVEGIRFGSLIHDIGKIGVPAEILSKPSRLTALEMELIQVHPKVGYEIVKDIEFPWPVAQMILQHHERLDGAGYPAKLKAGEIILEARIIAVADTVEAMSSHRPYRPGLGMDAALAEIAGASGVRYDKPVVDACIRLIREKGFTFTAA